jgi:hypothetical protein
MALTLELPEEVEVQLRQEAEKAGLEPQAYIVNALRAYLRQERQQPPHLSQAETELLQQLDLGLSQETWRRYHTLIEKRRSETLSKTEQQELISLSDQIEKANARRMGYLVELARLRGISLRALMDELGIQSPSYV